MIWTCGEFERWLDDGRPERERGAADAHAALCGRCGVAFGAAHALEEALARPPAAQAPAGFTDAVMRRLSSANARRVAATASEVERRAQPWWASVATDPAMVVLCMLATLLAWHASALWALAADLSRRFTAFVDFAGRAWGARTPMIEIPVALRALSEPTAVLGLSVTAAAMLFWVSWYLARWSEQMVSGATAMGRPARRIPPRRC